MKIKIIKNNSNHRGGAGQLFYSELNFMILLETLSCEEEKSCSSSFTDKNFIQIEATKDYHVSSVNNPSCPLKSDSTCSLSTCQRHPLSTSFNIFDRNVMAKHISGLHMSSRLEIETALCNQVFIFIFIIIHIIGYYLFIIDS